MKYSLCIMLFLAVSCGTTQIKEKILKQENQQESIDNKQKASINFDGPTPDHIVITSSGNGPINVNTIPKQKTTLSEKQNTSFSGDSTSAFSVDYWVESTPSWVKLLILFAWIIIVWSIWIFIKTSVTGKVLDAQVGAGLETVGGMIAIAKDKLMVNDNNTPEHIVYTAQLRLLQEEQARLLAKQKPVK